MPETLFQKVVSFWIQNFLSKPKTIKDFFTAINNAPLKAQEAIYKEISNEVIHGSARYFVKRKKYLNARLENEAENPIEILDVNDLYFELARHVPFGKYIQRFHPVFRCPYSPDMAYDLLSRFPNSINSLRFDANEAFFDSYLVEDLFSEGKFADNKLLEFSVAQISKIPKESLIQILQLECFKSLEYLNLARTANGYAVTMEVVKLMPLQTLQHVNVSEQEDFNNECLDYILKNAPELQFIVISGCTLIEGQQLANTFAECKQQGKLTKLKQLECWETREVKHTHIDAVQNCYPELEIRYRETLPLISFQEVANKKYRNKKAAKVKRLAAEAENELQQLEDEQSNTQEHESVEAEQSIEFPSHGLQLTAEGVLDKQWLAQMLQTCQAESSTQEDVWDI